MIASIIEQSDSSSFVLETRQDGEHQLFDIVVADSPEGLAQNEYDSFYHYMIFNYALLGKPNAGAEDHAEAYDGEDDH